MPKVTLGTVNLNQDAHKNIEKVLRSNRLSYGDFCKKFESQFAKLHQKKYGLVCNSGTSALEIIVAALKIYYGWQDQDEVLVPATTFPACINVLLHQDLKPVLVDVDSRTFTLDPSLIENRISSRTRAILPIHLLGQPADLTSIARIAKKYGLVIIEDSCETILARHNGKMVGHWGVASAFSIHSAHLLGTGIGGVILTDNLFLKNIMASLINHGRDESYLSMEDDDNLSEKEIKKILKKRFHFKYPGYSFRLSEFEAAVGLAQLKTISKFIKQRQSHAKYLSNGLKDLASKLSLPYIDSKNDHVFMNYPLVVNAELLKKHPNILEDLLVYLESKQIETRYLFPLLNQPICKNLGVKITQYPVARSLIKSGFYIGCHQDLTQKELDHVIKTIKQFFKLNI